ncbi:MAG: OmpA family protein [Bacteroidales bacterium]|nr:OmpA family protein [Bacteroidales bacterium]
MKRIFAITIVALLAPCFAANAQSFLDRLKDRAKDAVEENIGNKVEKGVNDLLDGNFGKKKDKKDKKADESAKQEASGTWTCEECGKTGNTGKFCADCGAKKPGASEAPAAKPAASAAWTCEECGKTGNTGNFCDDCGAKKPGAEPAAAKPEPKKVETGYAKSDFVPGDEIFFDDPVENERVGGFPLHWDFLQGEGCEIITVNGEQVIKLPGWFTDIAPLMKEKDYLPEEFTVEFDVWSPATGGSSNNDHLDLVLQSEEFGDYCVFVALNPAWNEEKGINGTSTLNYSFYTPSGDQRNGETQGSQVEPLIQPNAWLHVAASFNKRAFKYYVNGVRLVNLPNVAQPTRMLLRSVSNCDEQDRFYLKNIRIAKGAVPLYDRLMSDGRIITYAITFDTGKATIKPESMVEINRIAKLMKDNPGLEFEVQGHCDATGSDKVNDPLSQKRAEAIVEALVEQDIARARLTAVGKGSHVPIASNSTDEGRAKNRRVEFVKK